jgi:hypothetical protein
MNKTCDIVFHSIDSPSCTVTVSVIDAVPQFDLPPVPLLNELNIEYYFITYNYTFSNGVEVNSVVEFNDTLIYDTNPFFNAHMKRTMDYSGIILVQNQLTTAMIDMLFMSDILLSKNTGTCTPLEYKKGIIISLPNVCE